VERLTPIFLDIIQAGSPVQKSVNQRKYKLAFAVTAIALLETQVFVQNLSRVNAMDKFFQEKQSAAGSYVFFGRFYLYFVALS
jgi:hypothetical protein